MLIYNRFRFTKERNESSLSPSQCNCTFAVAIAKIYELEFQKHPAYSLDLPSTDFHLFSNLIKLLGGKNFARKSEVINAVNGYFAELEESFYKNGIMAIGKLLGKSISS